MFDIHLDSRVGIAFEGRVSISVCLMNDDGVEWVVEQVRGYFLTNEKRERAHLAYCVALEVGTRGMYDVEVDVRWGLCLSGR